MKKFEDLVMKPHAVFNGTMSSMHFDNGYGVSVIQFDGSYGNNDGLFELAVLKGESLCYDTEITDDVIGWLSPIEVSEIMEKVQLL